MSVSVPPSPAIAIGIAPAPVPFWGPVDSNIDWCEPNYVFTPYVAELMNTLSSIPLCAYGLYGLYHSLRVNQSHSPRFTLSFLTFMIVGLGSIAFHCTLRRWAQAADELPMLWAAILLLYNTIDNQHPWHFTFQHCINKSKSQTISRSNDIITGIQPNSVTHRWKSKLFFIALAVTLTAIYFYFPTLFLFFFLGYGITLLLFVALMAIDIFRTQSKSLSPLPGRLLIWAFLGYVGGFILWSFENGFCDSLSPHLYFHAIWHIAAGFGTYCLIQSQIAWRAETQRTMKSELIQVELGGGFTAERVTITEILPFVVVRIGSGSGSGGGAATTTTTATATATGKGKGKEMGGKHQRWNGDRDGDGHES